MDNDTQDRDRERALADVFDRSARMPSGAERVRLSAHATSIPGRRRVRLDRRVVWPAALAAAAAISYLVVAPPRAIRDEAPLPAAPSAVERSRAPGRAVPAVPEARSVVPLVGANDPSSDSEDPFGPTSADDLDELEPLELGPLFAPTEPARTAELTTAVEHLAKE